MPKVIDHDEYREELLNQCFDLFAQQGYAALSMRRIADELEVSTGTLYHYFSGKEELFRQLVEQATQQDLFHAEKALQVAKSPDERIDALLRFIERRELTFLNQSFIWMDYYRHQVPDQQANPLLEQVLDRFQREIARLLDIDDPELVDFILVVINGLVLQRYFDRGKTSFQAQADILRQLIHQRRKNRSSP